MVPDLFPSPSPVVAQGNWWEHAIRSAWNVLAVSVPHSGQLNQIVKMQLWFWEPLAEQREREEHKSSNHVSNIWFKWLAWNCTRLLWQKKERKNTILQGKIKKCPFLFILLFFFIHRAPYNSKAQQDRRPSLFSDPVTLPQPQAVTTWRKSDLKKKAMLVGSSPIPLYSSTICCQQGRQDNTMVFISKGQLSTKQKRGYTWKFWILSKVSEKLPLLISDKASFSSGLPGSHREAWGLVVFK